MARKMKIVYISWAPYCSRSDNTARNLDGKSYMVYYDVFGSNYFTIAFKYLFQTIKTLGILFRERPDCVFVMNPSVLATLPVYLYCVLFQARYVIDAHTGVLSDESMFKRVRFLQRFFSRRAVATIVTSEGIAQRLRDWQSKYIVVPDIPIRCDNARLPALGPKINVTLVNTYSSDEPLANFLAAARELTTVQFRVTGKINKRAQEFVSSHYDNIEFTDFLPDEDYYGLLLASDLIVVLTTRDMTMQRGAYEAIYLGKPVVTSNWTILRENFSQGTLFVDNSVEGIREGIREALANINNMSNSALQLKQKKIEAWQQNKQKIFSLLEKNGD